MASKNIPLVERLLDGGPHLVRIDELDDSIRNLVNGFVDPSITLKLSACLKARGIDKVVTLPKGNRFDVLRDYFINMRGLGPSDSSNYTIECFGMQLVYSNGQPDELIFKTTIPSTSGQRTRFYEVKISKSHPTR